MITFDGIRGFTAAFPEVEETVHVRFRQPVFRVRGKPFAGGETGEATAVFSVSREEAATAVAENPDVYEEVWRPGGPHGRTFVGLRVGLAEVSRERVRELVEHAWRNKAPSRTVAAYDAR